MSCHCEKGEKRNIKKYERKGLHSEYTHYYEQQQQKGKPSGDCKQVSEKDAL